MGVAVSLGTTRNTIKSLRQHANARLKSLPPVNMIYDNFDMDFRVAQPTAGHQGTHISVTAATFAPYIGTSPDDLRFTKELHKTSRFNKDIEMPDARVYRPTAADVLPICEPTEEGEKLDSLNKAFAWHFRAILVEQEPSFAKYKKNLDMPDVIDALPVKKTYQFPANAINADESQNDGNWEVLKSLLQQVSSYK